MNDRIKDYCRALKAFLSVDEVELPEEALRLSVELENAENRLSREDLAWLSVSNDLAVGEIRDELGLDNPGRVGVD